MLKAARKINAILEKIADATAPEGVSTKNIPNKERQATPLALLQENSDDFLLLMHTLDPNSPIKHQVEDLYSAANNVQRNLQDISKELLDVLSAGEEDLQLEGELNTFASALGNYSKEFSELVSLSSLMHSMIKQEEKEEKHQPVEHKLEKVKIAPEKKEEKETAKNETLTMELK